MRISPEEWNSLDLRTHGFLKGVALLDVWAVDLPYGPKNLTLLDLKDILSERVIGSSPVVRFLVELRKLLGRILGWEKEQELKDPPSDFRDRISTADREASMVPMGTADGPFEPFRVLYVFPRESASEIWNATVHAILSYALIEKAKGYRLYWAVYVRPVGRLTKPYLIMIEPFRRLIVYPSIFRSIYSAWMRRYHG